MHPISFDFLPEDDDANAYASGITGPGPAFTPLVAGPGDGMAHLVTITSGQDISGVNFTLTGTDADGFPQTEVVQGPAATTVDSAKYFRTLTNIEIDVSLAANTADVGWKDTCVGPTFPLNWREYNFQVSLGVAITPTINVTVQHTFDNIREGYPSTLSWWSHTALVTKTSSADGNYAFPVSATRIRVNSVTAGGAVRFSILQGN